MSDIDIILPFTNEVRNQIITTIANDWAEHHRDYHSVREIMTGGFKGIENWSDEELRLEWIEVYCEEFLEFETTLHRLNDRQ